MRVPAAWLRSYCDPGVATAEIADRLAMSGTEVERVAMLKYGVPDLRMFFDNDVRMLEQF